MRLRPAQTIANELENQIVTGELEDGERLDEQTLAEQFGVSRTPVREALQMLMGAGLVEQIPRRGVFIRQPGTIELLEMFEVMAEIEAFCGRLAAARISDTALAELQQLNAACLLALEAGDTDRYYLENERFHHLIYGQVGNGFLQAEALRLSRRLKPYRRLQLRLRGRMKQSMAEHEAIVDALAQGDEDAAASALRQHVGIQGKKFHHFIAGLTAPA